MVGSWTRVERAYADVVKGRKRYGMGRFPLLIRLMPPSAREVDAKVLTHQWRQRPGLCGAAPSDNDVDTTTQAKSCHVDT
jgi:hypothetical protein